MDNYNEKTLTRLHVNPVNFAISFEKPLKVRLPSIILKIPTENWPHCTRMLMLSNCTQKQVLIIDTLLFKKLLIIRYPPINIPSSPSLKVNITILRLF